MTSFTNDDRTYARRHRAAKQEARKKALEGLGNAVLKCLPHLDPGEPLFARANELWDQLEETTGEGEQPRLDMDKFAAEVEEGMRREGHDVTVSAGRSRD